MFNHLKLRTKLVSSFLIVALIGLIVCVIGIVNMNHLNGYIDRMYYKELLGVAHLKEMKSARLDAGRRWRDALLAKTPEEKRNYAELAKKNITLYKEELHKSTELFYDEKGKKLALDIYNVTTEWEKLTLQMVNLIVTQNLMEATPEFTALRKIQEPIGKVIDTKINELDLLKSEYAENTVQESAQAYFNNVILMNTLITFGFIASVTIGILFSRYLASQVGGELTDAIREIKKVLAGDFSGTVHVKKGDTTSLLYSLKIMQETILGFIDSQRQMSRKHHEGFISQKMDEAQFQGAYREMVQEINDLIQSHISLNMQVVDVVMQYAQGNFTQDIARLPAEKAKITLAVDAVKMSLLDINSEIQMLATASAQGDFSKRSDTTRFKFMFHEMLTQLNQLVESCDIGFNDVLRIANALAQGDLTQKITHDYPGTFGKTKEAMNDTVAHLKILVAKIQEASDTILTNAKEIAVGNNDLSERTEEQAASLEETAVSMQELTSTVQQNSTHAECANEMALTSSQVAIKGVAVVEKVISTMEDINKAAQKIVDIISVIDSIAFQTNILALNAAVEAARAGEQGRGFAVVASEVRSLAQRSAAAAGEIRDLIGDSVEKVTSGTELVAIAGKTMEEIAASIQNVTDTITQITASSVEQTAGIEQMNQAIEQIDDVTQQNAALVEQAAAATESLEDQTQNLMSMVNNFKINSVSTCA